jgi:hypothetical protein
MSREADQVHFALCEVLQGCVTNGGVYFDVAMAAVVGSILASRTSLCQALDFKMSPEA